MGDALRSRQASQAASETRAIEAERAQEELTRRRVEEERLRIAREVHDITAHSLSAVTLQAAVAERLLDNDPAAAKEAIHVVRTTSREALDELRAMVGVLREPNQVETAPTATTQRLEEIAAYLRSADVEVCLDTSGYQCDTVPTYLDVALFRITREAATNIVRHANARRATINLASDGQAVYLTIEDDGQGAVTVSHGTTGGHGIMGMRERATTLGGILETESLGQARRSSNNTRFDGRTVDDIAFGDEPFNAEALGVTDTEQQADESVDEKTGFVVRVTIPIQAKGTS
jgi:signal transduction histidine kinase